MAARTMVSKASVAYGPASGPHSCGNCVMFHPDGTCDLVKGRIAADATCSRWEARARVPALGAAAAEAYLSGWALSGGPFTSRVRPGCGAAAGLALERSRDPGILEAALGLGLLEGTRALIQRRRERLLRKHLKAILAAWDACIAGLDPADVVTRFRKDAYLHLTAEAATRDPQKTWWQDTARAAALGWLYALYASDGFGALLAAIEAAIRDGMAEGEADALALAAARQGRTGFAIAAAFKAALAGASAAQLASQQARDIAGSMIDGAASDVSLRLAKLAGDGAGEDEMTSGVQDVTTGDGARSARAWADWALFAGIGAGALGLYRRVAAALGGMLRGTVEIDWITDGDPCPVCLDHEKNGPYTPDTLPGLPAHPHCKCSTEARTRFPLSLLAPFLPAP